MLLPVYEHQIISKKGTLGLWPKHTDETAGVQALIHVESVSQLIYGLQRRQMFSFLKLVLTLEEVCPLISSPKVLLKLTKEGEREKKNNLSCKIYLLTLMLCSSSEPSVFK